MSQHDDDTTTRPEPNISIGSRMLAEIEGLRADIRKLSERMDSLFDQIGIRHPGDNHR